ncbi:MAG: glycosyl hydrolase, partial [Polyangiales bacterium]
PEARAAMAVGIIDRALHAAGGLAADGNTDTDEHRALSLDDLPSGWSIAARLPNARNHLGGAGIGALFFAVGGRHGWDEAGGNQATLSIFDTDGGTWSAGPDLALARSEIGGATFAVDSRLVVIGGSQNGVHPVDQVSVYDSSGGVWSSLPPLPSPRKGAVAARIGPRIVVTTGSPTSTDPDATTWVGCCL